MKRIKRLGLFLLSFLCTVSPVRLSAAQEEETVYTENEWNFVEASMDISDGIPENAAGRLYEIREAGKLTVVTDPYYAPQEFIDPSLSGQESYVGSDMELARRIAQRMGVELEIVPLSFSEVLASVSSGKYDLAISGLAYTPARAGAMEFSKGYYFAAGADPNVLLVREEDLEDIHAIEDLEGKNIVTQRESLQESLAADNINFYHEFRRVSSMDEVFALLEDGSCDAAVVDMENAAAYMLNNPGCGLAFVPDIRFRMEEQFKGDRVAAEKGETQLIAFVNGVIDEVLESGEYREWFETYADYAAKLEE